MPLSLDVFRLWEARSRRRFFVDNEVKGDVDEHDEKTWEPTTYQGISIWGHTPEGQTIVDKLAQFKTATQLLLLREDTVPALSDAGIPDD